MDEDTFEGTFEGVHVKETDIDGVSLQYRGLICPTGGICPKKICEFNLSLYYCVFK